MKKININSVLMTTLILFLICTFIAAALVGTNYLTAPRIAEINLKNEIKARQVVLPADEYIESVVEFEGKSYKVYAAFTGGNPVGSIVTTSDKGYGGAIDVMVGVKADGKINRVKVLSVDKETQGVGKNVAKAEFTDGYTDKSLDTCKITPITNATISSEAVNRAVERALKIIELSKEGESTNEPE